MGKGQVNIAGVGFIILLFVGLMGVLWILPQFYNFDSNDTIDIDEDNLDEINDNLEELSDDLSGQFNFESLGTLLWLATWLLFGLLMLFALIKGIVDGLKG